MYMIRAASSPAHFWNTALLQTPTLFPPTSCCTHGLATMRWAVRLVRRIQMAAHDELVIRHSPQKNLMKRTLVPEESTRPRLRARYSIRQGGCARFSKTWVGA